MIRRLVGALVVVGLLLYLLPKISVSAVRGAPGSAEFGFGAQLDVNGQFVDDAVQLANNLQVDWVSLDLSWKSVQPSKDAEVEWSRFDPIFKNLAHFKIAALVSLTQPPDWSLTPAGPDPGAVVQIVQQLTHRYSAVTAVELFPSANTLQGWGADPDPAAYMNLFKSVSQAVAGSKNPVILVAGGIEPVSGNSGGSQVGDLEYLQGLYQAGAKDVVQVISIRLNNLTGTPAAASSASGYPVLRHYEEIRDVMVKFGHQKGLLWITGLSVPSRPENQAEIPGSSAQKQAAWLSQALQQLRSQLYIGVAFLNRLNPPAADSNLPVGVSLIQPSGDLDLTYRVLRDQIAQNSSGGANPRPGRPKSDTLSKGH